MWAGMISSSSCRRKRPRAPSQQVIDNFDSIVPHFYDQEDRARGAIHSLDRRGKEQVYPLMAISIAVVLNPGGKLKHFGEASQIAMNLKKEAKKNPKSCYVMDKRARA